MHRSEIENIETELLLEAIFKRYGYDFRNYARASVERRIRTIISSFGYKDVSELIPRLLHDENFFSDIVQTMSITVTEMFRDPVVYANLREHVIPVLRTYPFIKIWNAGCASGEEAYSIAIVLKEEGLLEKSTIYATDFNDTALQTAREGIYPVETLEKYSVNYQKSGGNFTLSNYYHAEYGSCVMSAELKKYITFANHNLVSDKVFSEMHLILCRNVLIYFNGDLQERVLRLFSESLVRGGYLCLGTKESIEFTSMKDNFSTVDQSSKIFRKLTLK